jgi:hypothetical protein
MWRGLWERKSMRCLAGKIQATFLPSSCNQFRESRDIIAMKKTCFLICSRTRKSSASFSKASAKAPSHLRIAPE